MDCSFHIQSKPFWSAKIHFDVSCTFFILYGNGPFNPLKPKRPLYKKRIKKIQSLFILPPSGKKDGSHLSSSFVYFLLQYSIPETCAHLSLVAVTYNLQSAITPLHLNTKLIMSHPPAAHRNVCYALGGQATSECSGPQDGPTPAAGKQHVVQGIRSASNTCINDVF